MYKRRMNVIKNFAKGAVESLKLEKGSVESTHKVPTSLYRTKHCHAGASQRSCHSVDLRKGQLRTSHATVKGSCEHVSVFICVCAGPVSSGVEMKTLPVNRGPIFAADSAQQQCSDIVSREDLQSGYVHSRA